MTRILVTGRGGAASWTIRGEQIGAVMGATVKPMATLDDMRAHDVILVVKRVPDSLLADLQKCGRPWAYDIVDAFPQKAEASPTFEQCVLWLRTWLGYLSPTVVIWPNARMRDDWGDANGLTVYHHARPGAAINPIRERLARVGYEGASRYLDHWHKSITRECARRGIEFVINPPNLADVDVIVAVRGPTFSSYASRHWKSNVKLANAHATGTPFIGPRECGYIETQCGAEYWADDSGEFATALEWLATREARQSVRDWFIPATRTLEQAAAETKAILCALKS